MKYFKILMLIAVLLLTACQANQAIDESKRLADFNFIDQKGEQFGSADLKDKYWVASFIFTNCETVCPSMMKDLKKLKEDFDQAGIDAEFVLFSVDPDNDTPDVLSEYLKGFTEDDDAWHLLTGYSQNEIENFARENFETIVQKPSHSNQVIHGTNFYLINPDAYLLEEYNFVEEDYQEDMMALIKEI